MAQGHTPDNKQSLGQRWEMVGVVGMLTLVQHCIGPTLQFQQFKYCCWPNVGTSNTHQRWILSRGANVSTKTCLPTIVELSPLTSNLFY